MKRNTLIFGLISGSLVTALMLYATITCYYDPNFDSNMLLGFAGMLIAFSFIFVGIKNYRDKENNGVITFWQAFKLGLYISLIASTMYVLAWVIEYYIFFPDFMDKYSAHMIREASAKGATEVNKTIEQIANYKEMYQNPFMLILFTYTEIFPFALVVAVIAALIMKRKPKTIMPIETN